jgi:hypothetical protein
MDRNQLVLQWMTDVALDPASLNAANRMCSFRALDAYDVTIEWPDSSEDLFVTIDLMPSTGGELRKKRLERSMQMNAYVLETRGAAIGWDSVRDMLVLSYRSATESLSPQNLNNLVVNLMETAQYVADEIRFEADVVLQAQVSNHGNKWFDLVRA